MQKFIKFPSIGQFRDAIKQVQSECAYHNVALPTVEFRGTVKLHGTNAAVVIAKDGTWHCQSRERIITPESDNAGFAAWVYGCKAYWDQLAQSLSHAIDGEDETMQIYGEWCGGNIQKGVGLSHLPKMFVIFAVRFSEDAESTKWVIGDILKEELDTMIASGIEPRDVNGQIARKAREFFMNNLS